jgi:hypothetical protein
MAYVNVSVIHPNGKEYDGEVDDNAGYNELLSSLISMLGLPLTEDGEEIEYRLRNYLKIHFGGFLATSRRYHNNAQANCNSPK